MDYSKKYLGTFSKGLNDGIFEIDNCIVDDSKFLDKLLEATCLTQKKDGRLFFFGNGASASFSNHMSLDWTKNGKLVALSLSNNSLLTALANDISYEFAFKEFALINKLGSNDIVITISSSGNSQNILNIINYAKEVEAVVVSFSGLSPLNQSRSLANYSIYYPFKTYGMVECAHQFYLHLWLDAFMGINEWNRDKIQNMNINQYKL